MWRYDLFWKYDVRSPARNGTPHASSVQPWPHLQVVQRYQSKERPATELAKVGLICSKSSGLRPDPSPPHMTGVDLSKELMRLRPDTPIIVCTGFSELITEDEAKAMGIRELLMKPVARRKLAEAIRRVLGDDG